MTTVSYKNHKQIRKDRSEWIVIENNHEPIISRELWDKVREVDASVSIGKTTKRRRDSSAVRIYVLPRLRLQDENEQNHAHL